MSRSLLIGVALALAAASAAVTWIGAPVAIRARGAGPACAGCNVILVSLDTLRADRVGAFGHGSRATPNLDRLATRAVVFEWALSQSAWTRPAHFSMFTGLYPVEHGVVSMTGHSRVPDDVPLLAERLRDAGYATAAFTGGANVSAHFGFDRGFDLYETHGKRLLDNLPALEGWIGRDRDRPFFLFVHGLDAHRPFVSERVDREAVGAPGGGAKLLRAACASGGASADRAAILGVYDAAVHRGDRGFGRLLSAVDAAGLSQRTVIIVTSDHGEELLEHGGCYHIYSLHREVLHVPLVVYVPGVEARRVAALVPASVAIAPTVLELVGVDEEEIPGPSLVAHLNGGGEPFELVVSETGSRARRGRRFGRVRALTTPREKLIHWVDHEHAAYYDLVADPHERRPITTGPDVDRLLGRLDAWLADHPPRTGSRNGAAIPARLRRELRALGYVD